MNGRRPHNDPRQPGDLRDSIARRVTRKRRAQRRRDGGVWFGLGMFGLVGWSVAIPTLLGLAAGIWIDAAYPSRFSWTLMLLVAGVALGCLNAWYWIARERDRIEADRRGTYDE